MLFCSCLIKGETHTQKKKPTKCPKFKCNTVSVSFSACRCSSVVFSSKVGREKKKSLETGLCMAICGCGLPARCCQPAVAGGFIYADLRGELSTHLAPQVLFTQSSPVREPLLQAFPFPSTLGKVTLHPRAQACMFIYSSHGNCRFYKLSCSWLLGMCCCSCRSACLFTAHVGGGSSPLSCGVFLPLPLSQAFPLVVAGHSCPVRPGPACLFTVLGGIPLPSSSALRAPHPLCYMSLLFLLLITQFLLFPRVGVSLSRGLC
jgi:hypothetical protein